MAKRLMFLCGVLAVPLALAFTTSASGTASAGLSGLLVHPATPSASAKTPCQKLASAKRKRARLRKELAAATNETHKAALRAEITALTKKIARLRKACAAAKAPTPPTAQNGLEGGATCFHSGPSGVDEDECDVSTHHRQQSQFHALAASADVFDSLKVVVVGPNPRQITNMLCPSQLPRPALATTTNANDTLICTGGSLPADQPYKFNIRLNGAPAGDSVRIFEGIAGTYYGPLTAALQ